jgi:SAM-dependent methyltransferase
MKDRFGKKLMQWRIAAVLPHLRGRVLDIGCGTNELLARYRVESTEPEAGDSVGVDIYDWPGADLLVRDSSDLPYPDASFDSVAFVASLNHIPNRREVLRECRRLVRPGGTLLVTMLPPRLSWAWHQVRRPWDADQTERGMQPGEVYGLTRRQVDELLEEAGFEPELHHRFMLGINLLTVASPVEPVNGRARPGMLRHPAKIERGPAREPIPQPVAARVAETPVVSAIES